MKPILLLTLAVAAAAVRAAEPPAAPTKKAGKPAEKTAGAQKGARKPRPKAPSLPAKPMAFSPAELDLAPGEHYPTELFVPSPTGKTFKGALAYTPGPGVTVKPDARWSGALPPWGVKTYPTISAAADAQGKIPLEAALENGGKATLIVNIVALPVEVAAGQRALTVRVTSPFKTRLLSGRLQVSNPDRFLQDITAREFKVEPGKTEEIVFPLPGAAPVEGTPYDFTLTVETYQGYHVKKTYPLTFPPQEERTPAGVEKK